MDTLIVLNKNKRIIQKIINHIELFNSFINVYLFGSIIKGEKNPNDIDLLLIYKDFSYDILIDINNINYIFNKFYGISFDLTILSENEEKETEFIIRLNSKYLRLK